MANVLVLPGEGEGKGRKDLSYLVLERLLVYCGDFREGNTIVAFSAKELIDRIEDLFRRYPPTLFTLAVAGFHLWELPAEAQAIFYCLCELFHRRPLVPVSDGFFRNDAAHRAFFMGIEALLENRLAIAVAVAINNASDSEVKKDRSYACELLFKGREDLISPSVVARFGTGVSPW